MDTETLTSKNILNRVQQSALFNKRVVNKYNDFIFGGDTFQEDHLAYAASELEQLISLDPKGEKMMAYQRLRIIEASTKMISLSGIIDTIETTNYGAEVKLSRDTARKTKDDKPNIDENRKRLRESLQKDLPEFIAAIESGISNIISQSFYERNKIVEDLSGKTTSLHTQTEELQEQTKKILDELSMLPTKLQVSNYSELFGIDSDHFRRTANWWLTSTIACLAGIIGLSFAHSYAVYSDTFSNMNMNDIIQINISKILILSALFYALSICNKNYKMNKHNQILNKHRKNALSSFQAFVGSPSADETTKNAVLLEATRTIYGTQQTGYMNVEADDSPIKIIELINAMSGKKI